MLKGLGSFLGRLFGGTKTAEVAFDMVKNGVDSLVLTNEEKVQYSIKGVELYLEYLKITFDGGHLARRLIGLIVTCTWVVFCSVGLYRGDLSVINSVSEPFMAVMIFYFGAGIVTRLGVLKGNDKS